MDYEILGDDDGDGASDLGALDDSDDSDAHERPGGAGGARGREPGPPRRPAGLLLAAVAGLGALAVVLLTFGSPGDWSATPAAPVPATPSPSPAPSRGWVISDGASNEQDAPPRTQLSFGTTCAPALDGRTRLTVSFEVINTGATQLRLLDARPQLPLPGYLKLVRTRAGGDCKHPGDENAARRLLAPGEPLLVTWTFRLLQDCPKPAPVGVKVRVTFVTGPVGLSYPLLPDLGEVPFTDC